MMTSRWITVFAAGLVLWVAVPTTADFYDNFYDGSYQEDPSVWDVDDPCWIMEHIVGDWYVEEVGFTGGLWWLRLYVTKWVSPLLFSGLASFVDSGDSDPSTSETYWDDTSSHYIVVKTLNNSQHEDPFGPNYPYDDPNHVDTGMSLVALHTSPATWQTLWVAYYHHDDRPWWGAWFGIQTTNGPFTNKFKSKYIRGYRDPYHWPGYANPNYDPNWQYPGQDPNLYDPNDPNWEDPNDPNWIFYDPNMLDPNNLWADPGYMNERDGFWICLQLLVNDANYPSGDPNGKSIKAACWNGGKFDWDGTWTLSRNLTGWDPDNDPDPNTSWWPEWYWAAGLCTVLSGTTVGPGLASDMAYTGVEARTGVFTNVSRSLTLEMKNCCDLTVDPDLLDDPKHDPNDLNELRRYTNGTAIVLHAVVPCGNKTFKKWRIEGPNDSNDPLYQVVSDTNEVLYLTMDGDYLAKAICKCGGGGVEPFAAIVLLVLGFGVVVRRLT